MAHNLDKQTSQYQQRFRAFLERIDDGTFEGTLDKLAEGMTDISPQLQKQLNEQIQTYEQSSPSRSVQGFIKFIGRSSANSILGPAGLSFQDFQNPNRLANKVKKTALQSVSPVVASTVRNPTVAILNRIKGRDRLDDDELINDAYKDRVNQRRVLQDPLYTPESYEQEMRRRHPDHTKRLSIIQNNSGNNFYSNYEILHEARTDNEITPGLSEYLIKFHILNDDKILIFRMANFTGLTDSVSVTYNDVRYFGRPESLKQYDSVARNVAFSFDVIVDDKSDIDPIYRKLDILMGLCYPNSYTNDNIIQPNILQLSIGRYYNKMPFFPTNITYTADDEMVHSEGKPRSITVTVSGDIIQSESNPKIQYGNSSLLNKFIDRTPEAEPEYEQQGKNLSEIEGAQNTNRDGIT